MPTSPNTPDDLDVPEPSRRGATITVPPIPEGLEDLAFQSALEKEELLLRGTVEDDRQYALLICGQLDDGQPLADLVHDVAVGCDLPTYLAGYVIGAAVGCYGRHHLPTLVAQQADLPEPGTPRYG